MMSQAHKEVEGLLDDLTFDELVEVRDLLVARVSDKEARFIELVQKLEEVLNAIQDEFPRSYVPLQITPDEFIDLNDYMIPKNFVARARIEG